MSLVHCIRFLTIALTLSFTCGAHTPFVVVSPPKCGTHLIGKTLELMLDKKAHYFLTEIEPKAMSLVQAVEAQKGFMVAHNFGRDTLKRLIDKGYKVIFIMRDPRDHLISILHWVRGGQWPWVKATCIQDVHAQLEELITGKRFHWRSYQSCLYKYMQKVKGFKSRVLYTARFENLVGPQGQGTVQAQVQEILNLAKFLNVNLSYVEAKDIGDRLFGNSGTFREGQIGSWKRYFSARHKELYKERYADILIQLEYEKDSNW